MEYPNSQLNISKSKHIDLDYLKSLQKKYDSEYQKNKIFIKNVVKNNHLKLEKDFKE